jgi:hypothetical protein
MPAFVAEYDEKFNPGFANVNPISPSMEAILTTFFSLPFSKRGSMAIVKKTTLVTLILNYKAPSICQFLWLSLCSRR